MIGFGSPLIILGLYAFGVRGNVCLSESQPYSITIIDLAHNHVVILDDFEACI